MSKVFYADKNLRVRTSVGHGEKTLLGVLSLEVLIGELLTVDGLATSALLTIISMFQEVFELLYVRCHG
jgi:hypothetical protein